MYWLLKLDKSIAFYFAHFPPLQPLRLAMVCLSALGEFALVWTLLALRLMIVSKYSIWFLVAFVVYGLLLYGVVGILIKLWVRRPRPLGSSAVIHWYVNDFSFPSGHAASAVFCLLVLTHFDHASAWFYTLLAAGIIFSRLFLGKHYITDIVAGMTIGVLLASLALHYFPT
jgi:undecaprenyl-diphosphatase